MSEALLQLVANSGVIANEVARPDKEVEKIEPSSLALQAFIYELAADAKRPKKSPAAMAGLQAPLVGRLFYGPTWLSLMLPLESITSATALPPFIAFAETPSGVELTSVTWVQPWLSSFDFTSYSEPDLSPSKKYPGGWMGTARLNGQEQQVTVDPQGNLIQQ